MTFLNPTNQACPSCNREANGYAFAGHTFDYFKCSNGHVWHKDDGHSVYGLDDCPWYDIAHHERPFWAQHDCGGRMLDTEVGVLCENHLNTMRGH